MNKLVVLTDLGTFKAFRLEDDHLNSAPRLQPVDATRMESGDDRISRQVTDQAGQFRRTSMAYAANNYQSDGEAHNLWLENERRSVKQIADRISQLLGNGEFGSCYLAASSEINRAILDELSPEVRDRIEKNVSCNLVNAKREDILQHFA
jgi:hypothetical protein